MNSQITDKQILNSVLVGLLLFVVVDYFSLTYLNTVDPVLQPFFHKLNKLSLRAGEIMRVLFVFVYSLIMWSAYKNKLTFRSSLTTPTARYTYIFLCFAFIILFAEINRFPENWVTFLYPFVFLSLCVFIILLTAAFNEVADEDDVSRNLTVEKTKCTTELGFSLAAHGGYVNIPNPFRSIYIGGGSGSGKTASGIEPIIFQSVEKDYCGFVYDFKFPTLADVTYSSFLYHKAKKVKFCPVSFTDMSRSLRYNAIDPELLTSSTYAEEYAYALYCNLDKEMIKKSNFFSDSAVGLLKSVIWFMKKTHPEFCTLPHVVNIILNADTKTLVKMIASDVETKGMVKSVAEADEKGAAEQLAGVVGSLTMQIQKINTPEIVWVLTGSDFTLDLNNPMDPKYVVFGSLPELKSALNPVIAFSMTIALKLMNSKNKQHSVAIVDEGPTIYIPNLDSVPATARSNKLCIVYSAQDFSQIDSMNGEVNRRALVGNLGTQMYAHTSELQTAKHVSDMLGEEYKTISSRNIGGSTTEHGHSTNEGVNYSKQKRKVFEAKELFTLPQGTMVGKCVESQNDWFYAKMKRVIDDKSDFRVEEITPFIENFILTQEETSECRSTAKVIISDKINYIRDKEINLIFNKFDGIREEIITQNERKQLEIKLLSSMEELLITRKKTKKKNVVLDANFLKIQSEVNAILTLYKI